MWYLSDELITLSIFSDKVSIEEKNFISSMLIVPDTVPPRTENSLRFSGSIDDVENVELWNFISPRSCFLFFVLNIDTTFLASGAENWANLDSYINAKRKIDALLIGVNDSAERGLRKTNILIEKQKVRTEQRLQDAIVYSYDD